MLVDEDLYLLRLVEFHRAVDVAANIIEKNRWTESIAETYLCR